MSEQNFEGSSHYTIGDTISFTDGNQTLTGKIIHIVAPGRTVTGCPQPTALWVDCGDGWPHCVYSLQVVVK